MNRNQGPNQLETKSCDSKFNQQPDFNDSGDSDIPTHQFGARAARSYRDQQGSSYQSMTQEEQKELFKNLGKNLKQTKVPAQPRKRQKQEIQYGGGRKFTEEIIESESVSLHQSARSQMTNNQINKNDEQVKINQEGSKKKPNFFNLMMVGASSTGKTTYMNCFLKQYKKNKSEGPILNPTFEIKQHLLDPNLHHLNLEATIVDTPGFKASTFNKYLADITEEILRRNKVYISEFNKTMRQSSIYQPEQRYARDCRIHCCLLFFRGPRIHPDDWQLLKNLQKITNVIPVIAKGDCYTIEQVKQLKGNIIQKSEDSMIKWFDAVQYIRQKYESLLPKLLNGPYGPSPPFMIVGSNTKIDGNGELKLSREYRWGTCYIENEMHTEFHLLNKLLMNCFREGLVKRVDIKLKTLQQQQAIESRKRKNLHVWILGTIMGVTLVAGALKFKSDCNK